MASESEGEEQPGQQPRSNTSGTVTKLPPLPQGAKIQKRALSRPQQPGSAKTCHIYVSTSSPFMAVVKRVRKRLDKALVGGPMTKGMSLAKRVEALKKQDSPGTNPEVLILGTGKAIEKVLNVAAWFEDQNDCVVEVRTKTVGTVDDVVVDGDAEDESRVRRMSALEVTVRLQ